MELGNQLLQGSGAQPQQENLTEKLSRLTAPVSELEEGMLVSANYDGDKRVAVLKFYDPKLDRVWLWEDNTGHKPYCFTKLPRSEVLSKLSGRNDITSIDEVQKADLLSDSRIMVRKIVATDPLAIGGQQGRSIRDIMDVWEGDIKYYENYVYDKSLRVGTYYTVRGGNVSPVQKAMPEVVAKSLDQILSKNSGEQEKFINAWADLLGQPLCSFKRIATDIEVANEEGRIPDPEKADREVIAVSFYNESESLVYLVARGEGDRSLDDAKTQYRAVVFPDEAAMIRGAFSKMMDYPFLLTFNGDDFDLRYLKHRAEKLGLKEEEIPIALQRQEASLKHGVHIDLYRFFNNKSIQVYVYGNKYAEHTLNGISEAILGKSKIEFEGNVGDLPLLELANYCLNDSQLTFELTYVQSSLLMKILLVISRIAKMPMNDVARLGVSNWIRSMLFYEHRSMDAIIPRQDELKVKGGASSEAIIKGKKYKGGLVIEPKPGVHFDVSVLDFASLYPSIIKVHNLSYETVNCPHEECRTNRVPDTENWVCRKRSGITSLVIGSLRDLRVGHYKHLARDKSLSKEERELSGVVSQGLKVILNASYGVFGFETFALYCLPVAEATAAFGRDAITKTIEKCNQEGISVIYSDTDSLFIENPDRQKIDRVISWAEHDLGVELDIDKSYRYVAFSDRKKNYFGVLQDGTADIKGLTGKKSVSGDTPILARIDGNATFTNVESVYRKFIKAHRVELPTITDEMKTEWTAVDDATAHDVHDIYVLRTSKGRVIKLSGDHSVFFVDPFGRLYSKETRSVQVGEILVGAKYIPETGACSSLDLTDQLRDTAEWNGLLYSAKAHSTTGAPIRRFLPVTLDLGFIFGLFTAEGSTANSAGSRSNGIDQSENRNPEVCTALKAAWFRTFNWEIKQHRSSEKRTFYLPILYARLFREMCGRDSETKCVPDFIFNSKPAVVSSYLRGLFSGDGYSDGKRINLASKSRHLLEQVAYLLTYFDIDCRIRRMYNSKLRLYYHQLSIIGSSSRLRFQERIGFLQPRFQKMPRVTPRNKELLPVSTAGLIYVKARILKRLGLKRFRHINMHDARYFNLSLLGGYNDVIDALSKYADSVEASMLSSIRTMLNNQDSTYDEVVAVEKLPGSCRMYDFSVLRHQRFIAGNIPSLLHNSQTPEFLKTTFYQSLDILGRVYAPEDFEHARSEIKALLTQMVSKLRNKEVSLDDLAFNVMIGKAISGYSGTTPQHVKAANLMQNSGKEIKAGDIISFVKTKTPLGVKPVSLARVDEVDVDKYLEYASSMFDQMLDSLGFTFDEFMGSTTLDAFWS